MDIFIDLVIAMVVVWLLLALGTILEKIVKRYQ